MNTKTKISHIPSNTWNWLKMNNDELSKDLNQFTQTPLSFSNIPNGFYFEDANNNFIDFEIPKSSIFNFDSNKEQKNNNEYVNIPHDIEVKINELCKDAQLITINNTPDAPLVIFVNESEIENQVSKQLIYASENSNSTIIFVYKSDGSNKEKAQIIQTKVFVENNATIHIAKVQLLGKNTTQIDDTSFICKENSNVSFTQIELGGSHINSGLNVRLDDYNSKFSSKISYFAKEAQYYDFNHIVTHLGKNSECNMNVYGSLKDNSTKVYRGTIDFKKGSCGAKGNELEETLLLTPSVVNKSIPVILCDEEDVEGEHGATIGKLSSDILFYLQTRGIDTIQAEQLMTRAKIKTCQDLIPNEEVKSLIDEFLG